MTHLEWLFRTGKGNKGQNRWDLFNGVTEYVDHGRRTKVTSDGESAEMKRFNSSLFGTGAQLKQRAMNLLVSPDFASRKKSAVLAGAN